MRSRDQIKKELEKQEAVLDAAAHNGRHDYTAAGWIAALEWLLTAPPNDTGTCPACGVWTVRASEEANTRRRSTG